MLPRGGAEEPIDIDGAIPTDPAFPPGPAVAVEFEFEEEEDENTDPAVDAIKIEAETEESRVASVLSSIPPSPTGAAAVQSQPSSHPPSGLITPSPDPDPDASSSTSTPPPHHPRLELVISTRAQKARAAELAKQQQQQVPITPPLSDDAGTPMRLARWIC